MSNSVRSESLPTLGLFVDAAFRSQRSGAAETLWCGEEMLGFARFACAVGERFERLVFIARGTDDPSITPFELPGGASLAPLPHYPDLRRLGAVLAAVPGTVAALWRALSRVDIVWVSASHPFGLLLIAMARLRRRRVAILVRQDSMAYFRSRLPSRRWAPVLAPIWLVDRIFRGLARRLPTTVVGARTAQIYGGWRPNVLQFTVGLLDSRQIAAGPRGVADWSGPVRLLSVGRIEPEKNPLLLVDVLQRLARAQPGRFRATWVGGGRLAGEMRARAAALGLDSALELPGFVPFGEPLLDRYRDSHVFVHIALTEGLPAVITEAMATGIPVIATDVGGVREAVGDGAAALLVPPGDPAALADAVLRLDADQQLRGELVEEGLVRARATSLEAQSAAVARFLQRA